MTDFIHDQDLVGIDISQTEITDGEIYAVYFEGEGMIKQIFKEEGGKLVLHSLNPKYRDREVTEQNGLNFKVMGRQFWRAGQCIQTVRRFTTKACQKKLKNCEPDAVYSRWAKHLIPK